MSRLLGLICLVGLALSCKADVPCVSKARLAREDVMRQVVEAKVKSISLPDTMQVEVRDVVSMPDLQFGMAKVVVGTKTGIDCGSMYVSVICQEGNGCNIVGAIPVPNEYSPEECLVE